VATTTSPFCLPAAVSALASVASERPPPYTSAVSNQLIPPARLAATIWFAVSWDSAGQ
jgi:hypothetical protein